MGIRGAWVVLNGTTCTAPTVGPSAPTVTATGGMFSVHVAWSFGDSRQDILGTEIWWSMANNRSSALMLSLVPFAAREYNHVGLSAGQGGYYWFRVTDTFGNVSAWYPSGSTSGLYAVANSDPSALLTQLKTSLGLGQLAAELAAPIVSMPGALTSNAQAALQSALSEYDLTTRMQWQESVTNATVTVDPATGRIALLATANVTTDVEARLTAAEVVVNADHATLTSTVSTLSTVQGNLTAAQSAITLLQSSVSVGASEVYVDSQIANAVGGINVTSANAYTSLANEAIRGAIDMFDSQATDRTLNANVAVANATLQAHADAIAAEASSRTALVAVVVSNAAAIISEAMARANADSAEASARTLIDARVTNAEANIVTEQSTRASADSALASTISTLTATVSGHTSSISSEISTRASADSALASTISTLAATVSGHTSSISSEISTRASADSALASSISTLSATVGTNTSAIASVQVTATASASSITGLMAQYVLKVDTGGNVAGMQLASGSGGTSVVFLADKFAFVAPDGSGTPKQVMVVGNVNGTSTFGLDGNMIVDGSISANAVAARSISAGKIAVGALTATEIATNTLTADLIVSNSATSFEQVQLSIGNGAWASYSFYMHHAGYVAVASQVNFYYSSGSGTYTYEGRVSIDTTGSWWGQSGSYTNSSGPTGVNLQASAWLSAGYHTIYLYGYHSAAAGNHTGYALLLRSYR
jgi:hypothetical protein